MHGATVDILAVEALQTEFDAGIIYHDFIPENGTYPMVMYTDVTETPALHADNKLYGYEHIVRVTITTNGNAGINNLKDKVYKCMTKAGFMWQNTNKTRNGKEYYTSLDFSMGVLENET